jgi:hypothetical protein
MDENSGARVTESNAAKLMKQARRCACSCEASAGIGSWRPRAVGKRVYEVGDVYEWEMRDLPASITVRRWCSSYTGAAVVAVG